MEYSIFSSEINIDLHIANYKKFGLVISKEFIRCAELQLRKYFELQTGIKVNKHISFSFIYENHGSKKGDVSQLNQYLYINHNWNPVTLKWKSQSGRVYKLDDTEINCEDLEFWIEGLDVALIHKQLYTGTQLPFKLKDLSYELIVTSINLDCTLSLTLKEEAKNRDDITKSIDGFIADFNDKSEKKNRQYGVIHSWKYELKDNELIYNIDLGSTGPGFFKKLLPFFSGLNCFKRVEIC